MSSIASRLVLALGVLVCAGSSSLSQPAPSQPAAPQVPAKEDPWEKINKLGWQFDGSGKIGEEAVLNIPQGYAFLSSADTRRFLELQGNPPRDNRYVIAPANLKWFGVFLFDSSGYVRDDEKLDPDSLLTSLKEANQQSQTERKRLNLPPLILEGWHVPPHYDAETKRLEWGTKLRGSDNAIVVNYIIKILGRRGVMDALLVSDPSSLDNDIKDFKTILTNYSFNEGERYSEFRVGDKVAEYGLAALIVGGAAAAAAKSGAFKGLIKIIGVGAIAVGAVVVGFFKKLFRRT